MCAPSRTRDAWRAQEIDAINRTMAKVDAVKLVMQENVEIALQNCVTLEHIEKQAEDLEQVGMQTRVFWPSLRVICFGAAGCSRVQNPRQGPPFQDVRPPRGSASNDHAQRV